MADNFHFIEDCDPTLIAQAEKLIPALNAVFYGCVLVDERVRIVGANDDYLGFIKKDFDAIANKPMRDINPRTHLPGVVETGEPDLLYLLSYGPNTHCVASSVPVRNDAEEVMGGIGIVVFKDTDIARLRPLLEAMVALRDKHESKWRARYTFEHIKGSNPALKEAKTLAERAARRDCAILFAGETGTGKELFAHAVHNASYREGRFVPLNVAAIPRERLEEEIFGVAAFADTKLPGLEGKLKLANGGTLFLDEIGDLSPPAQALLLRVLEEKAVAKIGVNQRAVVDVRISATSRDLKALVKNGRFLKELYYRLNGVTITLPPLRERLGDTQALCEHLLKEIKLGREASASFRWLYPRARSTTMARQCARAATCARTGLHASR